MIIIHTVYCVLGRTSSGKSTITQKAANNLNMKVLKSYTTRQRRENETDENCDHIFISSNEVEKYRNDMIAYTDRVGYCSFATKQQLLDNDFYIINPTGYYELKLKTKDMDVELVTIMVNCEKEQRNVEIMMLGKLITLKKVKSFPILRNHI